MKLKNAKQKGKLLEDYVADQIIEKGLDNNARRDGASGAGTREKADIITSLQINGQNAGIECKNQAKAQVQEWWRQAQKLEKLGREPVVVYKLKGEGLKEAKAIIYLDTLLELIKASQGIKEVKEITIEDRELKWRSEQVNRAVKNLVKYLKEKNNYEE